MKHLHNSGSGLILPLIMVTIFLCFCKGGIGCIVVLWGYFIYYACKNHSQTIPNQKNAYDIMVYENRGYNKDYVYRTFRKGDAEAVNRYMEKWNSVKYDLIRLKLYPTDAEIEELMKSGKEK